MKRLLISALFTATLFLPSTLTSTDLTWYTPEYPVEIMQIADATYILDSPGGDVKKEVLDESNSE